MDTSISARPKRNWTTWCPNRRGIAHQNKKWSERYQSWGPILLRIWNYLGHWLLVFLPSTSLLHFFFFKLYVFWFLLIISGRHRTRMALSKDRYWYWVWSVMMRGANGWVVIQSLPYKMAFPGSVVVGLNQLERSFNAAHAHCVDTGSAIGLLRKSFITCT